MHTSPEQVYGFARFCDSRSAEEAIGMLNGLNFDPDIADSLIRATMAKRNLTLRREHTNRQRHPNAIQNYTQSPQYRDPTNIEAQYDQRAIHGRYNTMMNSDFTPTAAMGTANIIHGSGSLNGNQLEHMNIAGGYGSFSQMARPANDVSYDASYHMGQHGQQGHYMMQQSRRQTSEGRMSNRQPMANPDPCDTICVRGFAPFVTQADAVEIMSKLPGYETMNYVVKGGASPIAFVAFDSLLHSQKAIDELQGSTLPNHEGSLFVQFARRSCSKH